MLQSVSERLVERGHHVTVLTFDCATMSDFISTRGAGLPRRETLNGVQVIRVNPVGGRVNRDSHHAEPKSKFRAVVWVWSGASGIAVAQGNPGEPRHYAAHLRRTITMPTGHITDFPVPGPFFHVALMALR